MQDLTDQEMDVFFQRLLPKFESWLASEKPWRQSMMLPSPDVYRFDASSDFMPYSTCSAHDFFHPEFQRIVALLNGPQNFHRKLWEWVFIVHHALKAGVTGQGKRGLAFGVGQELLPAVFAEMGCFVTATDAPLEIAQATGWVDAGNQFASALTSLPNGRLDRVVFESLVEWRACDMNNIDPTLKDYDFCWSSCCLEHLGDLQAGLDFIVNSVVNTLKVGGVAIHTTEFNLSSNSDTVESGPTVIYRRCDVENLIDKLRSMGHEVSSFTIAPDSLVVDGFVDTPPYSHVPHLKLLLEGYISTSAGLVIRRMV